MSHCKSVLLTVSRQDMLFVLYLVSSSKLWEGYCPVSCFILMLPRLFCLGLYCYNKWLTINYPLLDTLYWVFPTPVVLIIFIPISHTYFELSSAVHSAACRGRYTRPRSVLSLLTCVWHIRGDGLFILRHVTIWFLLSLPQLSSLSPLN